MVGEHRSIEPSIAPFKIIFPPPPPHTHTQNDKNNLHLSFLLIDALPPFGSSILMANRFQSLVRS